MLLIWHIAGQDNCIYHPRATKKPVPPARPPLACPAPPAIRRMAYQPGMGRDTSPLSADFTNPASAGSSTGHPRYTPVPQTPRREDDYVSEINLQKNGLRT